MTAPVSRFFLYLLWVLKTAIRCRQCLRFPGALSFLAHEDFTTEVKGVKTLMPEYEAKYGTHLADNPLYGDRAGQKINYLPLHGSHLLRIPGHDHAWWYWCTFVRLRTMGYP